MKKIIVAVTGASGSIIGYKLLQALKSMSDVETHLILSEGAKKVLKAETNYEAEDFFSLADFCYKEDDLAALISSGSFKTAGMIVAPCSMKTLAAITCGYDENLVVRAADVCLKENRRVVLIPREMPFSKAHLRNLLQAANDGCSIIPPMLTFYNDATTLDEQIDHIIGKALMQFDIEYDKFKSWSGSLDK